MIKVIPSHTPWCFSATYGSNHLSDRKWLWDHLANISRNYSGSLFVGGDFNEVLKSRDKVGGNCINPNRSNLFWNYLNQCKLVDLGHKVVNTPGPTRSIEIGTT